MATIVLAGAGRVATQLGRRLKARGLPVAQVLSRTAAHARALAEQLGAAWSDNWADVLPGADWIILAVRDDAISGVARQLAAFAPQALVTHTSGATPGAVLDPYFERRGVFYPLQTFSPDRAPKWSKIPFCIDARAQSDLVFLKKVAQMIGKRVYPIDDEQRAALHLAAVFANNFANHCFAIAGKILEEKDLPFELLHPLMEETLAKALRGTPERMQTGPALRGDAETIRRHLDRLQEHPAWRDVYRMLSESINPQLAADLSGKKKVDHP